MAPKPKLRVAKRSAKRRITTQLQQGRALLDAPPRNGRELAEVRRHVQAWTTANADLLKALFVGRKIAQAFNQDCSVSDGTNFSTQKRRLATCISAQLERLEDIRARIDLFAEPDGGTTKDSKSQGQTAAARIFVVHGRNGEVRERVARYLERLRLEPVILLEQANKGRTVIEKFEDHADVAYALVLFTADDEGRLRGRQELSPRPRQNVVLELGYFFARLGRGHVCVLYERGVERPSDIDGILYVSLDDSWQLDVAKELRAAGVDIDFNRL
jgi:predicted nucleotide-binding protein